MASRAGWRVAMALALLCPVLGAAQEQAPAQPAAASAELIADDAAEAAPAAVQVLAPWPGDGEVYQLEIDAVDVSALTEAAEAPAADGAPVQLRLRFRPPQPLRPGEHAVRLFRLPADGAPELIGEWSLAVSADHATTRRLAVESHGSGQARLAESASLDGRLGPRLGGDGAISPAASWQRRSLRLSAEADLLWDTRASAPLDDLELGDFLLRAGSDTAWLQAGQQSVLPQPLPQTYLVDAAQRRGVAAHVEGGGWNVSLDGFATYSEPLQGFRRGFGLGQPDRRIVGGFLGMSPIRRDNRQLRLWLGSLQTRTRQLDSFEQQTIDNRTQSVSLDGSAGSWNLNAEYARSDTESADHLEFTPYDGDALRSTLSYAPAPLSWGEHSLSVSGSLDHHRVGSQFDSRANFGVPFDEQRSALNLAMTLDRLTVQGEWSRAHDNVDGLPIGRIGATLGGLYLTLAPGADVAWYGAPTWTASAVRQRNEQLRAHPDPEVGAVDDAVGEYQAGLRLEHETWGWGVSHRRQDVDNDGAFAFEQSTDDTSLELAGYGAHLSPRVSLIRNRQRLDGETAYYLQTGLGLKLQPGAAWSLICDAAYARSLSDNRDVDDHQWVIAPSLSWQAPVGDNGRLDLALAGNYQRAASAFFVEETWTLLLTLGLTLPWEYTDVR